MFLVKMISLNSVRILFLLTLISVSLKSIDSNEDVVSVRINEGVINGKVETSVDNRKINVFKGIPFAEPPIGDLRFKRPQPVKEWSKTLDAFEWPNPCYQSKDTAFVIDSFYNKNVSEDCLYMNIITPSDCLESEKLLPVIFYIHGGGLIVGASGWKFNDISVLTAKSDVVTVTVNYRLNAFGFLFSGTDDAPGNVGLWDQALALEWVNDNIRYFGGDPKQITIMGVSAGGWSASLHVLSPISRNLFQNAYFQSGAYNNHMIDGQYKDQTKMWLKGSELIGCNDQKVSDRFTPEITECLRKADPDSLLGMIPEPGFQPWVVIDGKFLPKSPTEMLRTGDFKQNVNILFSTAVDEGSFFVSLMAPHLYVKNITYEEAYNLLKEMSSKFSTKFDINGEDVAKVYFSGLKGSTDSNLLKRTIGIAVGDYLLGCAPILFAKEVFKNSHFKSNVYQYYWNRKVVSKRPTMPLPEWSGPFHGGDSEPVYGLPFLDNDNYSDDERERSEQMMKMVSNFVRTGSPTIELGKEWPKFFTIDDHIIAPFYEFTSSAKSDTNFGIGLKINECEYLWQKYLM